jgi:myo-inositol-1(or 4)-monophosphatase
MRDYLEVCLEAARKGGQVLLDWQDRFSFREKGPRDLVTEADVAAQEVIRGILLKSFPSHDFLGEEEAADRVAKGLAPMAARRSEFRWVVDPLDGTANYVHRMPGFAVSIALQKGDEIVLGVVFDPKSKECFTAVRGEGASLNGQPLKTSGCERLNECLIAVSFSPNVERGSLEITRFVEALHACQSVRRLGSAALNLAFVASGRLDAYWATSCSIWDVAAGFLLVEEAGGTICGIDGQAVSLQRPEFLASASQPLERALLGVLESADELHLAARPGTGQTADNA